MDRRLFVATITSAASCARKRELAAPDLALVANSEGQAVAAVDLNAFAVIRHIPLNSNPGGLAVVGRSTVAALTPSNGTLHLIDSSTLTVSKRRQVAGRASSIRVAPDGGAIYVLADRWLQRIHPLTLAVEWQIGINEPGASFALSPETPHAIVSGHAGRLTLINLAERRIVWQRQMTQQPGPVRFLKNGRLLLVGARAESQLLVIDPNAGSVIVELPLPFKPAEFCFKQDGGQLFITGEGLDAVAVVYPFQTQVAGTVLAGRAPGTMAASAAPDLLFVANPQSGEVTVMDIRTHKIRAVVPVGTRPESILITPDNNFALVLNRGSGDMAVIRVDAMSGRRTKAAPLFTMIPVGSAPVDAVVVDV
jgi:YVTN family beta-propeller protein